MVRIENFSKLSKAELEKFAADILGIINTKKVFTDDVDFILDTRNGDAVEAFDLDGNLYLSVTHDDKMSVECPATWTSRDESDMYDVGLHEVDYENYLYQDAQKSLKTLSTEIDGYKVTIECADCEDSEDYDVEVTDYHEDDDGIGDYEFWGSRERDSRPYLAVKGNIVKECTCYFTISVEPIK